MIYKNNNNNNNSNNNYCDNNNNIKLNNLVFNNIYIRKIIFKYLNKYNILYNNIVFNSIEQWDQFKYKEYLNDVTLYFKYDFNQLPLNISCLRIPNINCVIPTTSIPDHIKSIKLLEISLVELESLASKLNSKLDTVDLSIDFQNEQVKSNLIPNSVTNLNINGVGVNLFKGFLPNQLKVLSLFEVDSFEDGCFPESITKIENIIANPLIINQMSSFNNLVRLRLITHGYDSIESNIRFPNSLQELTLTVNYTFNTELPINLKTFSIFMKTYKYEIKFPTSLEHLSFEYEVNLLDQEVFKNRQLAPPNLKSLIATCNSIVDCDGNSIIPDKLEMLSLDNFNQVLQVGQLPSSLTNLELLSLYNHAIYPNVLPTNLRSLTLGYAFDQIIEPNVLPSNLKNLIFSNVHYSQFINSSAIPQQLETLYINNTPINLPISTHPKILVKCNKLKFYYQPSSLDNSDIRVLKLPNEFNEPLSKLNLQNKSSLEHLHLGFDFNQPILLSDLPINNNIKKLELSFNFKQIINLEYFQKLETIIINGYSHSLKCLIKTTINNNNNSNSSSKNNNITYNTYNLKDIIVDSLDHQFLLTLDINFYQFLKNKNKNHF